METQYENAPIIEALIDIRIEPLAPSNLRALEDFHESIKDRFPVKQDLLLFRATLSGGGEVGATARQTHAGFRYVSKDEKRICQARLDGFAFSKLRPYSNWRDLREEARELWDIYRTGAGEHKITRIAVRYINRIDIPAPAIEYKDYFRTTPEISPSLPQALTNFYMQLVTPQKDLGGTLVLTQASVDPPEPGMVSVILDLDVFKAVDESAPAGIWETLETLRLRKNQYFEGSITDRTRALFGERRTC